MSHGPLISLLVIVSRTRPRLSSTSRQPAFAVAAVPSVVGRLPTTTQPEDSTDSAVVSPIPPGHRPGSRAALMPANRAVMPVGLICMIVVPVPWALEAALKLLTRTQPWCRRPVLRGTTATPYGFTSPLSGTVEATVLTVVREFRNGVGAADAAAVAPSTNDPAVAASIVRVSRTIETSRASGCTRIAHPTTTDHAPRPRTVQPSGETHVWHHPSRWAGRDSRRRPPSTRRDNTTI